MYYCRRTVLAFSAVPAICTYYLRDMIEETPRFQFHDRRMQEAQAERRRVGQTNM